MNKEILTNKEIKVVNVLNKNEKVVSYSQEELEKRAEQLIQHANSINEKLSTLEGDEKDLYIATMAEELGVEPNDMVSTDLPASDIIPNFSIRVLEQVIRNNKVVYPILKYQKVVIRANGVVDIHYKDYTDNDSLSGFSDVVISDYNQGLAPIFRETYKVDTETHNGYDMLDTILNDVMITPGLFAALLSDFSNNIGKPFTKFMYQRLLKFLDNTNNYDGTEAFNTDDIKEQAKQVHNKLISLGTPSRSNLILKPEGATQALEYSLKRENTILIIDAKYAVNYKYDLTAGTFQLGEIQLPVSDVIVVDFNSFTDYITPSSLQNIEVIILDKNAYEEFIHYQATKITDTPKLKKVINVYMRNGNLRFKDAVMYSFTKYVPTPPTTQSTPKPKPKPVAKPKPKPVAKPKGVK